MKLNHLRCIFALSTIILSFNAQAAEESSSKRARLNSSQPTTPPQLTHLPSPAAPSSSSSSTAAGKASLSDLIYAADDLEVAQQKLFTAATTNDIALAQEALEAGADINAINIDDETALIIAVKLRSVYIIEYLLTYKPDSEHRIAINKPDKFGVTPFMHSLQNREDDNSEFLLLYCSSFGEHIDIWQKDKKGDSAFTRCLKYNYKYEAKQTLILELLYFFTLDGSNKLKKIIAQPDTKEKNETIAIYMQEKERLIKELGFAIGKIDRADDKAMLMAIIDALKSNSDSNVLERFNFNRGELEKIERLHKWRSGSTFGFFAENTATDHFKYIHQDLIRRKKMRQTILEKELEEITSTSQRAAALVALHEKYPEPEFDDEQQSIQKSILRMLTTGCKVQGNIFSALRKAEIGRHCVRLRHGVVPLSIPKAHLSAAAAAAAAPASEESKEEAERNNDDDYDDGGLDPIEIE